LLQLVLPHLPSSPLGKTYQKPEKALWFVSTKYLGIV